MTTSSSSSSSFVESKNATNKQNQVKANWCAEKQIYINGQVPTISSADGNDDDEINDNVNSSLDLDQLLNMHHGILYLFGYGSLCWNPGDPKQDTLAMTHLGVTSKIASVQGYKRCWAQKSADHRGIPTFPGIVCTLLKQDEIFSLQGKQDEEKRDEEMAFIDCSSSSSSSCTTTLITTGVLFTIPAILVHQVLMELDFREKGGYARDIITVLDHETGQEVKALLYRGTPENPAFWYRAYRDLTFASAVISQAIGPSGPNDIYLKKLDQFLAQQPNVNVGDLYLDYPKDNNQHYDSDTRILTSLTHYIQLNTIVYFLVACGSNQHDQLSIPQVEGISDFKEMTEAVLFVPKGDATVDEDTYNRKRPKQLYAGGGHSAFLTIDGYLYLWGWNQYGQLGRKDHSQLYTKEKSSEEMNMLSMIPIMIPPLSLDQTVIKVEKAALGHFHTLIIEKETQTLYAFGENSRGQVTSQRVSTDNKYIFEAVRILDTDRFVDIAAGLYHSAAVAVDGSLVTFGDARFGVIAKAANSRECARWSPEDGSHIVHVACGHRHTVALDEHGRIWTMGDNTYAQLGRLSKERRRDNTPHLVQGLFGGKGSRCCRILCGWSHTLAVVSDSLSCNSIKVFGWGRNDRGQLGLGKNSESVISIPQFLFSTSPTGQKLIDAFCGSESTHVVDEDGKIWGCGWNEHGNLGSSTYDENVHQLAAVSGARLVKQPCNTYSEIDESEDGEVLLAAGGAHLIAMLR